MIWKFHKKVFIPQSTTYTSSKNLINISQTTSEKIEESYLNDFLKNCIKLSKNNITINSKLFYSYFEKNNQYEIFFIENYCKKNIPFAFVFSEIHNKQLNEIFLYDKYFIVYSKGELKLFKEFTPEISSEDIQNFIFHRYELNIDKIHKYTSAQMEELKKQYHQNKQRYIPQLFDLKKEKRVISLFGFTLFLFLIPFIHYNFYHTKDNSSHILDKKLQSLERKYNNLLEKTDKKKSSDIINTLLQMKSLKLKLQTINLNKNKMYLFIEAKDKISLLDFIDGYKGNIKINKLSFNEKTKKFNMEILIVI